MARPRITDLLAALRLPFAAGALVSATLALAVPAVANDALARSGDRAARAATAAGPEAVLRAVSLVGVPYRWGGDVPETGLDCSGLVHHVYSGLGIDTPRDTAGLSRSGEPVARKALEPGDLVFFNTLRRAFSHVGIYLGGGRFVHAPSTGAAVRIESMDTAYWRRRFDGARRLVDPADPTETRMRVTDGGPRAPASAPDAARTVFASPTELPDSPYRY